MTSVATNGSWVTRIMNTSAGSSGARRTQESLPHLLIPEDFARSSTTCEVSTSSFDRGSAHLLPPQLCGAGAMELIGG